MATIETYARPTWLYRYRSLGTGSIEGGAKYSREIDAILQGYIYCSEYKKLNDPSEGFYRASKKATNHPAFDNLVEQLRNEKLGLGIASFSETWDNQIMWAHYADAFQGICICYAMSSLLSELDTENALCRVAYGDKPYYLNLPSLKNDRERARAVLSTKHLSWSYEREWRLFSPIKGKAEYGTSSIKSVYLGAKVSKEVRDRITQNLRPLGIPIHRTIADGYSVVKRG